MKVKVTGITVECSECNTTMKETENHFLCTTNKCKKQGRKYHRPTMDIKSDSEANKEL